MGVDAKAAIEQKVGLEYRCVPDLIAAGSGFFVGGEGGIWIRGQSLQPEFQILESRLYATICAED